MDIQLTNKYIRAEVLETTCKHRGIFRIHYRYDIVTDRYFAELGIPKTNLARLLLTNKKLPQVLTEAKQYNTPHFIYYELTDIDAGYVRDLINHTVKQLIELGAHSGNNT